ncbi:MAG: ribonuclease R, partial [Ramlibacter sp.]
VQVSRVDLDGRKIDFRLVREGEELVARALKDKGVPSGGRGAAGVPAKSSTKRAARRSAAEPASATIHGLKAAVKKAAGKSKSRKSRR